MGRETVRARLELSGVAGELAGKAIRSLAEFYSVPEHQAFLAGCVIGGALTHRMRFLPGLLVSLTCGLAAEKAYLTMREVQVISGFLQEGKAAGGADPADP